MKVAYLGNEASYSFGAAKKIYPDEVLKGYKTIRACIEAAVSGECAQCVVPLENSIQGGVNDSIDALIKHNLFIVSELVMPIHECLIGVEGTHLSQIKTVYSHPQALSQCEQWLKNNLPDASLIAVSSTSEGIDMIGEGVCALGSASAKKGTVLVRNVEDFKNNATRFIALAGAPSFSGSKVSLMFEAPNRPGGLVSILRVLEEMNINMTRIESRPMKNGLGRYLFFVDFIFEAGKDELMKTLAEAGKHTGLLKFLGLYKSVNLSEVV